MPAAVLLLLLAVCAGGCAATDSRPAVASPPAAAMPLSVGVVPLADRRAEAKPGALGLAVQESMTWVLKREPRLLSLDLEDLVQRSAQGSDALATAAAADLPALARRLGVGLLVGGTLTGDAERVTLEIVAVDARGGAGAPRTLVTTPAEAPERAARLMGELLAARGLGPAAGGEPVGLPALVTRARGVAAMADASTGGGYQSLRAAVTLLDAAAREAPDSGETWYRFGEALLRAADYTRAREAFDQALALARGRADAALELAALVQAGEVFIRSGRHVDAESRDVLALPLAQARGDRDATATILHGLSIAYFNVHGDHPRAVRACEEARDLYRAVGDRRGEAKALIFLGGLNMARGDFDVARTILREAVEVARAVHDPRQELTALNDLGEVAYRRGGYDESQALFDSALALARAAGDRQREAFIMANLGRTLVDKGHYAAALPYARQALDLAQAIGAPQYVQLALVLLGAHAAGQGDYAAAQRWWEQAVEAARATGSQSLEARSLYAVAEAERRQGALDSAGQHYAASLAITRRARLVRDESLALTGLGQVAAARGDRVEAERRFDEALVIARSRGVAEVHWQALYGLGVLQESAGRDDDAARSYREAVDVIRRLVGALGARDRQAFLASEAGSRVAVYDALARVLLRLHQQRPQAGHDAEAWAVLEARKGEIVAEALQAAPPQPRDAEGRQQAARIQVSGERAVALEAALRREADRPTAQQVPARIEELTTLLARTKGDYQREVDAFLLKYPQYALRFREQATVDPAELSKVARRLPPDTLVVQYFAAPDRLYLFVVARGDHYEVKTHAVKQADLYRLVYDYRRYLERAAERVLPWTDDGSPAYREAVEPLRAITAELSAHLLAPLGPDLARYPNLILVPNDVLLYLPFHALTVPGAEPERFLAETHVVSYVTRRELVDLFAPGGPAAERPLLAVANPDGTLSGAAAEVRSLKRLRSSVVALEGREATKAQFMSLAGRYADLHLATHGHFDGRRPELSYLVMAGDDDSSQRLTVREIAGLSLEEGGLATLSACETALGEHVPGAALITLAAAFSQAGAQSVVASLWRVVDRFTRLEMEAFYRAVPTMGRAAALTAAERTLLKDPRTRHPYYWAGFILIGAR